MSIETHNLKICSYVTAGKKYENKNIFLLITTSDYYVIKYESNIEFKRYVETD